MTDGINLNLFGTTVKGLGQFDFKKVDLNGDGKITRDDADLNRDGEVTQEELDYFNTFYGFSFDDLSIADINGNDQISSNEFIIAKVKSFMQEIVDGYKSEILAMDSYSDEEKAAVAAKLVSAAQDFYKNYDGKVSQMQAAFTAKMKDLFNQIKTEYNEKQYRDKYSAAVDLVFEEMKEKVRKKFPKFTDEQCLALTRKVFHYLENDKYTMAKAGDMNIEELGKYLLKAADSSNATVMQDILNNTDFAAKISFLLQEKNDGYIDQDELRDIKSAIYIILQEAVNNGITINLSKRGVKITNEANIQSFLSYYNDGYTLISIYYEILDSINNDNETLLDRLAAEFQVEEEEKEQAEYEQLIDDMIDKTSGFGNLSYSDLGIEDLINLGSEKVYSQGWVTKDRVKNNGGIEAATKCLLDKGLEQKFINAVKNRCNELGIEYTQQIEELVKSTLGDAILVAIENNYFIDGTWMFGFGFNINVGAAIVEISEIFNEKFATLLKEHLAAGDIVKTTGNSIDTSKVTITVASGIDPTTQQNEKSSYSSSEKDANYKLSDLLNGTVTSTLLLSNFDEGGNSLDDNKTIAISSINLLLKNIAASLINGGYNADRVEAAKEACKNYYEALINNIPYRDPDVEGKYTKQFSMSITYNRGGESVTEDVSYYYDNHCQDKNRVSKEHASDNSSGIQLYSDGNGRDHFFFTVDLAKVVQNFFRFL